MEALKKVAITGATGFIGINLLNLFIRHSVSIKALCRPESLCMRPNLPGIDWIEGSLEDEHALEELVSGTDAVIHCAGLVKACRPFDFFRVNTEGTLRLLKAVEKTGFEGHFIFMSSLAARHPELSPYAKSKHEAEKVIKANPPAAWTIIRPPAVYGPGDKEILPIFRSMEKGIAIIPAPMTNSFSLIHVLDLSEAVLDCCAFKGVFGRSLELHDGTPGGYTWKDVVEIFQAVRGKKVFSMSIPKPLLKFSGFLGLLYSRISAKPSMITPWKARELLHPDWVCANHVENHGLSWTPRLTLKIALENGLIG